MPLGVIAKYTEFLPVSQSTPRITLGEGDTPLVRSGKLASRLGDCEVYFKLEGCNPTGSFKDRGMVVAVAKAQEAGSNTILCASTGNTSASAAAYGARCGMTCIVLVPKGDVASGKLAQAIAYGARVLVLDGTFDQALRIARELVKSQPITLVNSVNPFRLQGQKTAAFEIVDALDDAPDYLCLPVGNAGNITAYWMGFKEYQASEHAKNLPRMLGFQAEGAAPIVKGHVVEEPKSVASAIRIGNPASWEGALKARDESGGIIEAVSDEEIMEAYRLLAQEEGIFCEPASAAGVAGLLKAARNGLDLRKKRIVCIITGTGLKDPDAAKRFTSVSLLELPPELTAVREAITAF